MFLIETCFLLSVAVRSCLSVPLMSVVHLADRGNCVLLLPMNNLQQKGETIFYSIKPRVVIAGEGKGEGGGPPIYRKHDPFNMSKERSLLTEVENGSLIGEFAFPPQPCQLKRKSEFYFQLSLRLHALIVAISNEMISPHVNTVISIFT